MASKTVVILGGGVGGMIAANELRRRLPAEHCVLLIERNAEHAFASSFLWLMTGDRKPDQVRRPLRSLLRRGVEFVHASVDAVDLQTRQVITKDGEFSFDYLIIAVGAELAPELVPGVADGAHSFYTFEGAVRLQEALGSFSMGRWATSSRLKTAVLHHNLGNAFLTLAELEKRHEKRHAGRALRHFDRALQFYSRSDHPCDYAKTQLSRGQAYVLLAEQGPEEHLHSAEFCFSEARECFAFCENSEALQELASRLMGRGKKDTTAVSPVPVPAVA